MGVAPVCKIRQVGGAEIEVVCPPQQVVEVKQAQDEVELVGCVAVNCCGVVCFVCLIHPELVVEVIVNYQDFPIFSSNFEILEILKFFSSIHKRKSSIHKIHKIS